MTKEQSRKNIIVLYHNNCPDGFGAAWAAWKKFGSRARYIGVNHQESPPKGLGGNEVYILDFCYPLAITKKLLHDTKKLVVLDHHVSSKGVISIVPHHQYALHHSGSVLSWKFFHPKKKAPLLLRHIEDVDIWKFSLSHTQEIIDALAQYDFDFQAWSRIARALENKKAYRRFITEGSAIARFSKKSAERIVREFGQEARFLGERALVVNAPMFRGEIKNSAKKLGYHFSIAWWKVGKKMIVSLRSFNNLDVSRMAARFGGGGHRNAAGFSVPFQAKFPWKEIKTKK